MTAEILDITPAEYHALDAVSRGGILDMLESSRLYHAKRVAKTVTDNRTTAAALLGVLQHDAVLRPDYFDEHYVIEPSMDPPEGEMLLGLDGRMHPADADQWDRKLVLRPKFTGKGAREKAREWEEEQRAAGLTSTSPTDYRKTKRALWEADNAGRTSITKREHMLALGVQTAILAHPTASRLVAGDNEQALTWTCPETGLRCKSLRDARPAPRVLADLKTTFDPSPDAFNRTAQRGQLHLQDAFYTWGESVLLGCDWEEVAPMTFIVVRSVPPHEVALYVLPDEARWAGKSLVESALRKIADCSLRDDWHNEWEHTDNGQPIALPDWPAWATRTMEDAVTEALANVDPLDVNQALSSSEEWKAVQNRFEKLRREGAMPAHVKSAGQAMAIARFGYSFGWDEMRSLRSVYIVKGNPTLKTEAMVALVREKLPDAQIQVTTSDDACTVRARRSADHPWNEYTFTMADAKRAGLLSNPTWKSYPFIMLRWRALSQACRVEFPDATNGAYSLEEMQDAEFSERGTVRTANVLPPELVGDQRPAIEAEDITDAEPAEPGSIGEQVALGESPLVETCELCGGMNCHDIECPHWTEAD